MSSFQINPGIIFVYAPSQWEMMIADAHAPGTTAGKRSRHASRHVRDARAVMHAGIAN